MHRLFVAIKPPASLRQRLLAVMGGVTNARWQTDDQLHLTVRFIGEVDRRQAEDVASALSSIRFPSFEIELTRIGSFEKRGRASIIWIGLSANEPLTILHLKVDQACVRAGLPPDHRAFHPHITLARLPANAGPLDAAFDATPLLAGTRFDAREFALFESRLSPAGPSYTTIETYPLD